MSAPRVATPSSQCGPGPYLSQMLEDKHLPSQPPPFHPPALHSILPPRSFLASRAAIVPPLMRGQTTAVLLLHLTAVLSSLQPSSCIPLPMGSLHPSIHLFPPIPLFSPPPSSLGLLPLSALLRGKEPCVCCLAACRLLSTNPPLLFFYLKLPSSSSFFLPLIPRCTSSSPPFLSSATFSSYLLLSPSLSPPASNHSPLHLFHSRPPFILHSPSFSPSLPLPLPPSSLPPAGLRSSEQVLSPFDLGAFGLMLSAQLLKQLPPPDASQFGAGAVTYTHTYTYLSLTHTHKHKYSDIQALRCKQAHTQGDVHMCTTTHTEAQCLLAHCITDKANQLLYASLACNPGVCFCSLSKTSQSVAIKGAL